MGCEIEAIYTGLPLKMGFKCECLIIIFSLICNSHKFVYLPNSLPKNL